MKQNSVFAPLENIADGVRPSLLLHSCCAPCSSSVLETLCAHFDVTVLYYNPNIWPASEFEKRCAEQKRFCDSFIAGQKIKFVAANHRHEEFDNAVKGLENLPEGEGRCTVCYRLRLEETARYAKEHGYEYFTTTLSVSPLKDAKRLNSIGVELGEKHGIKYLVSDFKKQNGYKRSCELSRQFGMYRQDFCGCKHSLAQRILSAKGFIFDADGTLFDTMDFYEDFGKRYVQSLGFEPEDNIREQVRSFTIMECCEYIKEKYNLPKTVSEIYADLSKMLFDLYDKEASAKSGVLEFLEYARQKGIRMCIATATAKNLVMLTLQSLGIDNMFEFVLTCPEVGASKREPVIYEEAAKRLGLDKKDVVIFEDAHHAISTAKNAGFKVVAVRDNTELAFKEDILAQSDIYVESMMDLIHRDKLNG